MLIKSSLWSNYIVEEKQKSQSINAARNFQAQKVKAANNMKTKENVLVCRKLYKKIKDKMFKKKFKKKIKIKEKASMT